MHYNQCLNGSWKYNYRFLGSPSELIYVLLVTIAIQHQQLLVVMKHQLLSMASTMEMQVAWLQELGETLEHEKRTYLSVYMLTELPNLVR